MKEAMKLALEALQLIKEADSHYATPKQVCDARALYEPTIKALEEALAKQEEPLPPVEIGVDVTSDGASVVAFYRRPDAVMEMFYSQFHPLAKQEQGEPVAWLYHDAGSLEEMLEAERKCLNIHSVLLSIRRHEAYRNETPLYTTPQQRKPLTDAATIAGLHASIGHLSALVDYQYALLQEVNDVCGRDGHGGELEDGESDLIDRVRQHLKAIVSPQKREPLTDEQAHDMGAKGGEPTEAERLLFEAWMKGHCWAVIGTWDGKTYVHEDEANGFVNNSAMHTRCLWAAWRDRAALAAHGIKE